MVLEAEKCQLKGASQQSKVQLHHLHPVAWQVARLKPPRQLDLAKLFQAPEWLLLNLPKLLEHQAKISKLPKTALPQVISVLPPVALAYPHPVQQVYPNQVAGLPRAKRRRAVALHLVVSSMINQSMSATQNSKWEVRHGQLQHLHLMLKANMPK